MLRHFISISLLGGLLATSVVPASAFFQYNSNISLRTQVPYIGALPTYVPPANPIRPSVYVPGAPVLGTILDTWANVGNLFNWQAPTYGNYTNSFYSRSVYGNYSSVGNNRTANAQYFPVNSGGQQAVGQYTSGVMVQGAPAASYSNAANSANTSSASYTSKAPQKTSAQGTYNNVQSKTVAPSAKYVERTEDVLPTANYTKQPVATQASGNYASAVAAVSPSANYTNVPVNAQPTANYVGVASPSQPSANYTNVAANTQPSANYTDTVVQQAPTANYVAQAPASQVSAVYTQPVNTGGAAFGSLYGDGRSNAYGTEAGESFVSRIRGRSAEGYTSRAETFSSGNLGSLYTLNPQIEPISGPGRGLDFSTNYDRSFDSSKGSNLNAVPTNATKTPGQAVAGAIRSLGLNAPIVMNSTYTEDARTLQAKGIMPSSWSSRVATTELNRADIAEVLVRLRAWRETGNGNSAYPKQGNAGLLPIIGDLKNTDPSYAAFMQVAQRRMLYMPDLKEENGVVVYANAAAKAAAGRAQTLQGVMTALYLRPDSTLSGSSYTDLTADSWYSPWALTAKSYGLSYGTRFEPVKTVTQAELARMIAQLLEQFR